MAIPRIIPRWLCRYPPAEPWAYEMKIADPDGNVIWLGAEPKQQ